MIPHLHVLGDTVKPIPFTMVLSTDGKTGATGKTIAIKANKNGGTPFTPTGSVAEVSSGDQPGEYTFTPSAADANTLGSLTLYITASGCDPVTKRVQIVAINPFIAPGTNGGLMVLGTNGLSGDAVVFNGYVSFAGGITGDYITMNRWIVANAATTPGYMAMNASNTNITFTTSGSGARIVTITVNDGTTAIIGAKVRVTKGAETYIQTTIAAGVATFNLDDGDWTIAITYPGHTFAGTTLTVDGIETPTYSMTASTVPESTDPELSTIYFTALNDLFLGDAGIEFEFQLESGPGDIGYSLPRKTKYATSIAGGSVTIEYPRQSIVMARRLATSGDRHGQWIQIIVADASTTHAPEILGAPTV